LILQGLEPWRCDGSNYDWCFHFRCQFAFVVTFAVAFVVAFVIAFAIEFN
jgi:hypothetical protein